MPEKKTIRKAQRAKREGKSPSTQAGEFVKEEFEKIRKRKQGARSTKQAIAIGLSEARRAGVELPPPPGEELSPSEKKQRGRIDEPKVSLKKSRAGIKRQKREPTSTASHEAISRQSKQAAAKRSSKARHLAAVKAVKTKGKAGLRKAALKAARTRKENREAA